MKTVQPNNLLPEYPRPQLVRNHWINLNGYYNYTIVDSNNNQPLNYHDTILVPFCIESILSEVTKPLLPTQHLWYQKKFINPFYRNQERVILHFEAVDWKTTVYINKKEIGYHIGGYCPFHFDITDYLIEGENELEICVYDPTDTGSQQRGKQALNPKGIWYSATSGIWQTVWMEVVPNTYIESVHFIPDIDNKNVCFKITNNENDNTLFYEVEITFESISLFKDKIKNNHLIPIHDLHLWSPESPNLYHTTITLIKNDHKLDTVTSYIGMRKFSIDYDSNQIPRLFLNNQPYFQKGLLDQGYWHESLMTPPSEESMIFDIQQAKNLGFNMLRKHIKIEPSRWYYLCDKLGMLVWQDMISGGEYIGNLRGAILPNLGIKLKDHHYKKFKRQQKESREQFEKELFEMIDHLMPFTSIYCWVPFNEGWGQFDAKRIYELLKKYDPSRMIDHASGWYDQGCGDLESRHRYILPVPKSKKDGRVFVLSEYGGYSKIEESHVYNKEKSFGYRMYSSKEVLSKAYRKLHESQIIPLISKGLSATVYTQLSDIEYEVNGIFTYDRKIQKIDEETLKSINQQLTISLDKDK